MTEVQELCPEGSRAWVGDGQERGLESLQERLEEAAAVNATTTRNRTSSRFPAMIRKMATEAAKNRNPVFRTISGKTRRARREIDARGGCASKREDCAGARREKAEINGKASEDRESGWRR